MRTITLPNTFRYINENLLIPLYLYEVKKNCIGNKFSIYCLEIISMRLSTVACWSSAGACGGWLWRRSAARRRPCAVTARAGQPRVRARHDQYTRAPRRLRATNPNPSSNSDGAPRRVTV